MRKIYSLLLLLIFIASAFGSEQKDPFRSEDKTEWHLESIRENPYLLEIAYGECDRSISDEPLELKIEVDPDFLDSSTMLSIAVSPNKTGEVKDKGRHMVEYRVSENTDKSFDLKLYLRTFEGGLRETNTEVTLYPSNWIVISASTRSENGKIPQSYITAIRITPRAKQAGDDSSE